MLHPSEERTLDYALSYRESMLSILPIRLDGTTVFIYGLIDPRTGALRYVGQTNNPANRLRQHVGDAQRGGSSRRERWIRSITKAGLRPLMIIIETTNIAGWQDAERRQIARARSLGAHLINRSDGGEGAPGYTHSAEARARMSAAKKGRKLKPSTVAILRAQRADPALRAHLSAKLKGRHFHTLEAKAKISAAGRGRVYTPEAREKIRLSRLGKKHTAEAIRHMSDAHKGHPATRGTTGMRMSDETRANMTRAQLLRWKKHKEDGRFSPASHCKHGHAFTTENTYIHRSSSRVTRQCKTCHRLRETAKRAAARSTRP